MCLCVRLRFLVFEWVGYWWSLLITTHFSKWNQSSSMTFLRLTILTAIYLVKFVSITTVWGFDELGVFYWSHYFPGPEVLEPGVWNCSQQRHWSIYEFSLVWGLRVWTQVNDSIINCLTLVVGRLDCCLPDRRDREVSLEIQIYIYELVESLSRVRYL